MMTNPNSHTNAKSKPNTNTKPEVLQSWRIKVLIAILCILSFIIGWTSAGEHRNKKCYQSGGQVVHIEGLDMCQLP